MRSNSDPNFSASDAARQALILALYFPICRVTVLPLLGAHVFEESADGALLGIMQDFWKAESDFVLADVRAEIERQGEETASGYEAQTLVRALNLLDGPYSEAPQEPKPGSTAVELMAAIKRAAVSPSPRFFNCADIIGAVVKDASEANEARKTGQLRGPATGLKTLDFQIGGALPKVGPCMVLGNTGAGKTAFVSQIAANCGFPALFVTTEMAPAELFRRHMARVNSQFLGRFKSGELTSYEVETMAKHTAEAMPHLSFVDATIAVARRDYLLDCIERARGDAKTLLLVIDSLHTWTRAAYLEKPEYEALNEGLRAIQSLCHEAQCGALVVCEQNRASIKDGTSGNVNAGAGSRFIEYSAEIVFDLQASKELDGAGEKEVKVTLAKNRHGASGTSVKLQFNGALQRFRETV